MKLSHLLKDTTALWVSGVGACDGGALADVLPDDPEIGSLHYRSQDVRPGGLFIAVPGFSRDGHAFIEQAVAQGAAAVLSQRPVEVRGATVVAVENTRRAMALAAARFYGRPCGRLTVVGITGTNGKTTTASLLENMLVAAGHEVGVIGTLNCRYGGREVSLPMTTPESLDLQRLMAGMLAAGVTHAVMEVSSHALDLHRVDGCDVDVAVFSNLSRDHLDYHGDMASYWECKKRLFTDHLKIPPEDGGVSAVVNADDPRGRELLDLLGGRALCTGTNGDVRPRGVRIDLDGIRGTLETPAGPLDFNSPLIGRHNLENILSAAGAALALGLTPAHIRRGIETLASVPGRLERVPDPAGRLICVDYAHTPDALENALRALRELTDGRLVCVFGCGGDRDRGKRRQMGAIAARYADLAVVTSDNPRSEPPMAIIEEILPGVRENGARPCSGREADLSSALECYVVDPDRGRAIALAVAATRPGDALLIAGKGHETYQIVGDRTLPFDDRRKAREALERLEREAVS